MTKRPKNYADVTPVFGLTKAQLSPIICSVVQQPVASFQVTVEHQVQGFAGYSADKVIPTFTFTTESGFTGRTTIFVKRFHRTGPAEAHHYAYLQECKAPIPRMYCGMADQEGREILFLEYLKSVGDIQDSQRFFDNLDNFRCCLSATAHFNAIKPSGDYVVQLPHKNVGKGLKDACTTLECLWKYALDGDLGDSLKNLCSASQDILPRLQTFAIGLLEPIAGMDTGLIHGDIYPENTGWRPDTRELLILDLEWIGFGPRFWDAAMLLGAPDEIKHRDELAQYYLEKYAFWGGSKVPSLRQFLDEISILWMAQKLDMMWFGLERGLDGDVDWTDDREEGRQFFRDALYDELRVILRYTSL